MTTRTIHLDRPINQLHPTNIAQWLKWFENHGFGEWDDWANWIAVPSEMVIDDDRYTITVQRVQTNTGRYTEPFTIQLGQPATPTPNGYETTT